MSGERDFVVEFDDDDEYQHALVDQMDVDERLAAGVAAISSSPTIDLGKLAGNWKQVAEVNQRRAKMGEKVIQKLESSKGNLRDMVSNLESKIKNKDDVIENQKSEIRNLRNKKRDLEYVRNKYDSLKETQKNMQKSSIKNEYKNKQRFRALMAEKNALENKNKMLMRENAQLKEKLTNKESIVSRVSSTLSKIKSSASTLQSKQAETKKRFNKSLQSNHNLTQLLKVEREKNATLMRNMKTKIDEAIARVVDVSRRQLMAKQNEVDILTKRLDQVSTQNRRLQNALVVAEANLRKNAIDRREVREQSENLKALRGYGQITKNSLVPEMDWNYKDQSFDF